MEQIAFKSGIIAGCFLENHVNSIENMYWYMLLVMSWTFDDHLDYLEQVFEDIHIHAVSKDACFRCGGRYPHGTNCGAHTSHATRVEEISFCQKLYNTKFPKMHPLEK